MARGTPTRRTSKRRDQDGEDDDHYDMSPTSNHRHQQQHQSQSSLSSAIQQAKNRAAALTTGTTTATTASSPTRGPLPSSQETSYHKRLRTMLIEHKRLRKDWNELILRGVINRTRSVLELINEVESVIHTYRLYIPTQY